jgi:glycosyltransferase involved in cell wall biosynthesis
MISKIKILYLIGNFGTGGKERQLVELIKGIDPSKFELHLMIKSEGAHYLDEIRNHVKGLYNLDRKHFGWDAIYKIKRIIDIVKPDIVHSWASVTSVYAVTIKFLFIKRFIIIDGSIRQANPISAQSSIEKIIHNYINRFSNFIISNSKAGLVAYKSPAKKSSVIHNGFNFNRLEGLEPINLIKKKYGVENAFIIGMVARFDPQKDWDSFISIATTVIQKDNEIAFLCVGDGPLLQNYKDKIPVDLQKRIIFTGRSSAVESLVNAFDIAVLLSNNQIHGEGISNSVMEYMSLNKPVIVNNNGGNSELINSIDVGILIKSDNLNLYINKIFELKIDPELRYKMGQNAGRRIRESFSFEKMIDSYSQLYRSIAKQ